MPHIALDPSQKLIDGPGAPGPRPPAVAAAPAAVEEAEAEAEAEELEYCGCREPHGTDESATPR